ncbi:hypothetical protein GCM10010278_62210 [Streptomyces melanogenes]|nr:hypothetical protein GCM10010278_62210 [Streptomyces melanogenes]
MLEDPLPIRRVYTSRVDGAGRQIQGIRIRIRRRQEREERGQGDIAEGASHHEVIIPVSESHREPFRGPRAESRPRLGPAS